MRGAHCFDLGQLAKNVQSVAQMRIQTLDVLFRSEP